MEKIMMRLQSGYDEEWVALIKEAKELGVTIEEIRLFLTKEKRD